MTEAAVHAQAPDVALAHAAEIRSGGFTKMEALYPAARVAKLRAALEAEYRRAESPPMVRPGYLEGDGQVPSATAAGFAIPQILAVRPDLGAELFPPTLLDVVHRALGDDAILELAGGLISDRSRPFFKWHQHLGGIDEPRWKDAPYPRTGRPQRLLVLVYLQALHPEHGSLLVLPRAPSDPMTAPAPIETPEWPGAVRVEGAAGSAVLIEECTWHAALPQETEGLRMFVGFYFRARGAPHGDGIGVGVADPVLRSLGLRSSAP